MIPLSDEPFVLSIEKRGWMTRCAKFFCKISHQIFTCIFLMSSYGLSACVLTRNTGRGRYDHPFCSDEPMQETVPSHFNNCSTFVFAFAFCKCALNSPENSLNLGTVVTSWSYCSWGKWRIRKEFTVSRLSGTFRRLFTRLAQFVYECCVSEAILEVSNETFSSFCGLFLLLNNAMQAKFWSVVKVGEQVSIIFWIHRFFTKF